MTFRLPAVLVCLLSCLAFAQTRPTTRPNISFEPELRDALVRLDQFIAPDVRANKRPPNERERKLAQMMTILLMSERPDGATNNQKHTANMEVADKAVRDQYARMKADPDNASPAFQEQIATLEKLSLQSIHLLDLLSRPGSFPNQRESQLDLAKRLDKIPTMLDQEERINRDVTHQERRFAVMKQLAAAEKAGNAEKAVAAKATLEALDQLAAAQVKLDALIPMGVPPASQPTTMPVEK